MLTSESQFADYECHFNWQTETSNTCWVAGGLKLADGLARSASAIPGTGETCSHLAQLYSWVIGSRNHMQES